MAGTAGTVETNRYQRVLHLLDDSTHSLFGVLTVNDPKALDDLPAHPVMQRWWAYMKDIMETNDDNSPISIPLKEVFYLP
ncbi:L-rhamnose mutarotase [Paraflavitalea speifideaquila]|uniref:L-rhamnose mutarotase n=1 Tax=Paraflavitalea speifideaquila TaxID=3076558 RepID=UPI0028E2D399|nr:L-rhamnose mutarotase [Paraflavitalea speifideiaquila]